MNGYNTKRVADTPWAVWPGASPTSGLEVPRVRTTVP
jgi:hypothetical protein